MVINLKLNVRMTCVECGRAVATINAWMYYTKHDGTFVMCMPCVEVFDRTIWFGIVNLGMLSRMMPFGSSQEAPLSVIAYWSWTIDK